MRKMLRENAHAQFQAAHLCVDVALDEVRRCIHTCRSSQESDPL